MYKLTQDAKKASDFFDRYKEKVRAAIGDREPYWIDKGELFAEGDEGRDFFERCLADEGYLRKLLLGTPQELLGVIQEFLQKGEKDCYFKKQKAIATFSKEEEKLLKDCRTPKGREANANALSVLAKRKGTVDFCRAVCRVFVEKMYEDTEFKKDLVQNKELRVCPYCGRNFVLNTVGKGRVLKPQIDHFLPKSKFPMFAISYYNLIPSCSTCNFDGKGEYVPLNGGYDGYSIPHPYEYEENWNFTFRIRDTKIFSDFCGKAESVVVDFKGEKGTLEELEKLFAIQTLYQEHNDLAHELLIKKQFWASDAAQRFYQNILRRKSELRPNVVMSLLGYPLDAQENRNQPFGKFHKDLAEYYDEAVKKGKEK